MLENKWSNFISRWDINKNDNDKLKKLKPTSSLLAWFICENGHEYKRRVSSEFKKHSCKYCNSLAYISPETISMFTENNEGTPWDYSLGSEKEVELECSKHGLFKRQVKHIAKTKRNGGLICKECNVDYLKNEFASGIPNESNSLAVKYPQLIPLWSEKNQRGIEDFSYGSDVKAWWKCSEKDYHVDYQQSIYQKARKGTGCPYCSGKKLDPKDSFSAKFPEYAKLWSIKNKKEGYEYPSYSNEKVWFKCENGLHDDYHQTVNNKSHGKMCLKCGTERTRLSKLKPTSADNTIGFKRPKLSEFWSDKNVGTVYDYNYGTDQMLWWKCESGLHEDYQQKSSNKVFKDYRCPKCKQSRGELLIEDLLSDMGIVYRSQHIFQGLRSVNNGFLSFDFYVPEYKVAIEYDGIQHFEPVEYFGGLKAYGLQVENDSLKDNYCLSNDIKLLRIPYYLDDEEVKEKLTTLMQLQTPLVLS